MSDIVGYNEPLFKIPCNDCKHFAHSIKGPECKAYDKIPNDILLGRVEHDKVLPGQKGNFIFEPSEEL